MISSEVITISSALSFDNLLFLGISDEELTIAAHFLIKAKECIISKGIGLFPMEKCSTERWVCAPQYLSEVTFILPILSVSLRILFDLENWNFCLCNLICRSLIELYVLIESPDLSNIS